MYRSYSHIHCTTTPCQGCLHVQKLQSHTLYHHPKSGVSACTEATVTYTVPPPHVRGVCMYRSYSHIHCTTTPSQGCLHVQKLQSHTLYHHPKSGVTACTEATVTYTVPPPQVRGVCMYRSYSHTHSTTTPSHNLSACTEATVTHTIQPPHVRGVCMYRSYSHIHHTTTPSQGCLHVQKLKSHTLYHHPKSGVSACTEAKVTYTVPPLQVRGVCMYRSYSHIHCTTTPSQGCLHVQKLQSHTLYHHPMSGVSACTEATVTYTVPPPQVRGVCMYRSYSHIHCTTTPCQGCLHVQKLQSHTQYHHPKSGVSACTEATVTYTQSSPTR